MQAMEYDGKYMQELGSIAELLERKNRDYGNSYEKVRAMYGPAVFLAHITEKLHRAQQLYIRNPEVENESLLDTLRDIVGYATLELIYLQEEVRNDN